MKTRIWVQRQQTAGFAAGAGVRPERWKFQVPATLLEKLEGRKSFAFIGCLLRIKHHAAFIFCILSLNPSKTSSFITKQLRELREGRQLAISWSKWWVGGPGPAFGCKHLPKPSM